MERSTALTFGSLFAGIGGFDLGFERAGMECLWQVEIDKYARKVLDKHWSDVRKFDDVTKFCRRIYDCEPEDEDGEVWCPRCDMEFGDCHCLGTDEVIYDWGVPDVICGGDPCQENSNARQRTGLEQPSLGSEFIRVVDELRPRIVVRENPTAVRADAPWPWYRFRGELESLGYSVLPFRLRACCLGAEHRRDRLFLLAELSDTLQAGLQGDVIAKVEGPGWGEGVCDTSRQDQWSATPRVCGRADGISNRVDRLRGLGNAVVPQVAEWIGRRIVAATQQETGPC